MKICMTENSENVFNFRKDIDKSNKLLTILTRREWEILNDIEK